MASEWWYSQNAGKPIGMRGVTTARLSSLKQRSQTQPEVPKSQFWMKLCRPPIAVQSRVRISLLREISKR